MELYKRVSKATGEEQSPYWYFDITDAKGRRHRKSTGTRDRKAAQRVAAAALTSIDEEMNNPPAQPTLGEAVEEYVADLEGQGKVSAGYSRVNQRKLFGLGERGGSQRFSLDPGRLLSTLTERDLDALRNARRAEGAAQGTIALELALLRSAAMMAARRGAMVPVLRWKVPRGVSKVRWLTQDEWKRVYDALEPTRPLTNRTTDMTWPPPPYVVALRQENQDLLVALTMCGGRWNEVARMTVDQILPDSRVRLYGYKTGKERIVPVPPMFSEALKRRADIATAAGTPYLFPARPPTRHPSGATTTHSLNPYRTTSTTLRRAMAEAGCNAPHLVARDGKATVHSLRHTFASWLLQDGMSLAEVQDLVGHSDISQTRVYAHLSKGRTVDRATEVLTGITAGLMGGGR